MSAVPEEFTERLSRVLKLVRTQRTLPTQLETVVALAKRMVPSCDAAGVTLVEGSSFCVCEPSGDLREGTPQGVFFQDTRILSRWSLTVNGQPLEPPANVLGKPDDDLSVRTDDELARRRARDLASCLGHAVVHVDPATQIEDAHEEQEERDQGQ